MDQTSELIMNTDNKTRGGQLEFSNNANAFHRWILSFNQHAEISRSCAEMAGKAEDCHKKKELCKSQYKKDQTDVQNVMHTIESL